MITKPEHEVTNEELREHACAGRGCINYREDGYVYCGPCMRGSVHVLSYGLAVRKLLLEGFSQGEAQERVADQKGNH